jgi:hypothetical protein
MLKECFGKFGQGDCIECSVLEMCSSYFVVGVNRGCPLYGGGFSSANEICRLCVEYFDGRECKEASLKKRKRK